MRDTVGCRPRRRVQRPRPRSEPLFPGDNVRLLTSAPEMFPQGKGIPEPALPGFFPPRVTVIPPPAALIPSPPEEPTSSQIHNEMETKNMERQWDRFPDLGIEGGQRRARLRVRRGTLALRHGGRHWRLRAWPDRQQARRPS